MIYCSLICSKKLQSDLPKCEGMLVDCGATQGKIGGKTTVLGRCENRGLPQLSVCHLAVC